MKVLGYPLSCGVVIAVVFVNFIGTTSRRLLWSVIVKSFKPLQVFHYTLRFAVAILMTLELPYLHN